MNGFSRRQLEASDSSKMTFILKKIISPFFNPLPLAFALIVIGLALQSRKKGRVPGRALSLAGLGLILLSGYGFTGRPFLERIEYRYRPQAEAADLAGVKWVVVLGGGFWDDPRLSATARLTESSVCRLAEGIRIWRKLPGARLLLSGGRIYDPAPEAGVMAGLARELGVPDSAIVVEDESRDTGEQARLVGRLVGDDRLVLVTSAAHLPRSMALFRKQGMYPVPAASNFMVKRGQKGSPGQFFPSSVGIEVWETVVHEVLGLAWGRATGRL